MRGRELDRAVKAYLLNCINADGYDANPTTQAARIAFARETFRAEYGWRVAQVGQVHALEEWLSGISSAVPVAFWNSDILRIAKEWGSIPQDATEAQEDRILDNWFWFLANKLNQIFRGYNVPQFDTEDAA